MDQVTESPAESPFFFVVESGRGFVGFSERSLGVSLVAYGREERVEGGRFYRRRGFNVSS